MPISETEGMANYLREIINFVEKIGIDKIVGSVVYQPVYNLWALTNSFVPTANYLTLANSNNILRNNSFSRFVMYKNYTFSYIGVDEDFKGMLDYSFDKFSLVLKR